MDQIGDWLSVDAGIHRKRDPKEAYMARMSKEEKLRFVRRYLGGKKIPTPEGYGSRAAFSNSLLGWVKRYRLCGEKGLFESIIGEALVKSGYDLHYYKKKNSTLQVEFFVGYKDYLVPIEVKAGNNNSKSLSTLIKSDNYPEIRFGIKIVKGNIGFSSDICTFPYFCAFLIKDFLAGFQLV